MGPRPTSNGLKFMQWDGQTAVLHPMRAPPADLRPLPAAQFDVAAARHLLARAGFGGTQAQAEALAKMGLDAAVDLLVKYGVQPAKTISPDDFDRTLVPLLTQEERQQLQRARRDRDEEAVERLERKENQSRANDRRQLTDIKKWWLTRMIESARPLEEKMTLFWHGHFATGARTVEDSWAMFQQNNLFRAHATGSFATLVLGVIRDPGMLKYLDNDDSRKGRPNENLARELLELFILGEGSGYTEADIKEGARALTGYTFRDEDFVFRQENHDAGPKTIFGKRGNWNGDDFARMAMEKPACSEFICGKLYRFFVNDAPESDLPADQRSARRAAVRDLAALMRNQQYEMAPVLGRLFRSAHFYDPSNRGALIKSPVQLVVQTVRQLGTPVRHLGSLSAACGLMGQALFQPPNVEGWDGGRSWINTSTLFVRQNLAIYLLTGRRPDMYDWENDAERFGAARLAGGARDPQETVDRLLQLALAVPARPERRRELTEFAATRSDPSDRALSTLALITALPEYQLT